MSRTLRGKAAVSGVRETTYDKRGKGEDPEFVLALKPCWPQLGTPASTRARSAGEKRGFFGRTEPSGGSDPTRAIRTKAVRDGDYWIINGSKIFISGAHKADFGLVFARTDPGQRTQRRHLLYRRHRYE